MLCPSCSQPVQLFIEHNMLLGIQCQCCKLKMYSQEVQDSVANHLRYGENPEDVKVTCKKCDGYGCTSLYREPNVDCSVCKGEGFVKL